MAHSQRLHERDVRQLADQTGLLDWALHLKGRLKKVFLVHGEPEPAEALAAKLREGGIPEVYYPELHDTVSL